MVSAAIIQYLSLNFHEVQSMHAVRASLAYRRFGLLFYRVRSASIAQRRFAAVM
jgi:hypothetical protein